MGWHATQVRVPSRDGVELAVHDLGGDGPPLLIVHATGLLAQAYTPLAAELAPSFHVWGVDVRAHGGSTRPADGNLEWSGMAADVLAAVDAIGGEQPYGFGHSMGGASVVLAEVARPGTFRSMYLYEPVLFPAGSLPSGPDGNPLASGARKRRPSFASRDEAYANYAAKPPLNEMSPASLRAYVDHGFVDQADGTVTLACRPEDEAETFVGAASAGAFERLGEVRCPAVVSRGSLESMGPASLAPAQAEAFPDGRLVILDGLAHFGPLADERAVAASIVGELLGS